MPPTVEPGEKKKGGIRRLLSPGLFSSSNSNSSSNNNNINNSGSPIRKQLETAFISSRRSKSVSPCRSDVVRLTHDTSPTTEQVKSVPRSGRASAPPTAPIPSPRKVATLPRQSIIYEEVLYENHVPQKRVSFSPEPPMYWPHRPLPPLPRMLHRHPTPSDTDSEAGEIQRILQEEWSGDKRPPGQEQPGGVSSGREEEGRRSGRGRRDDPRRHTLAGNNAGAYPPPSGQLARSMDLESPLAKSYLPAPMNPMLLDDDPGIMSEVETSSTGFRRGNKQRSSLPVVRTPSKTLERPLGLVFLQYRSETKRALLPNEITSIDTVKALFVRSFPKQLTMEYMDSPHVKIYIHDSSKDMFYELEDLRSHLRDIRDRSVLRLFESSDVAGGGLSAPTWDQDQSYFSEPEFDSEYQHQHIHKTKGSKGTGYYMTHSFPPSGTATLHRGTLLRATPYVKPTDGYMSSPERSSVAPRPYNTAPYPAGYDDPYYAPQYPSARTGTITPVIDEEARLRVDHMERQLANLTGLVHKALTQVPRTPDLHPGPPQNCGASTPSLTSSYRSNSERDRHKPTPPPKPVSLSPGQYDPRSTHRGPPPDLHLTAEMYNQLRGLQKKAKDLRQEVRNLRRMSQTQAHTVRETIRDTFLKIRAMLIAGGEGVWSAGGDETRLRVSREGDLYRQQMLRLESDLMDLESSVEELRGNVINRKTRVNMSDVENMALILSKSSKTVAELKLKFPSLQESIKSLLAQEMEKVVSEEKFLKDEPERLESALRRCKKLTGTLVTLKRLASVQEQRLPDARLSPTIDESAPPVTPTSSKACGEDVGQEQQHEQHQQQGGERSENPLDALLDELQTFSRGGSGGGTATLRRLHSYPEAKPVPPPPPPRTSSKSPEDAPNPPSRQELLEQKHRELLRKQRQLQEQYTRLQQLQRAPPPDLLQLKKTGSESNLLGKMGLTLAPMTGSLSHLAPTTSASSSSSTPAATTSTSAPSTLTASTTTSKIYETDIL